MVAEMLDAMLLSPIPAHPGRQSITRGRGTLTFDALGRLNDNADRVRLPFVIA